MADAHNSFKTFRYIDHHHTRIPPIITLPRHLLFNILLRLPVKTILRCRCVCKIFSNSISDPEFGKLHFERSTHEEIVLRPDGPGSLSRTLYLLDLYNLRPSARLLLPLNDELAFCGFDVINSCNGLVCLCTAFDKNPVLVCNPITREYMNIPRTNPARSTTERCNPIECGCSLCSCYDKTDSESGGEIVASGFGYSPKTDEYKVIRIFKPRIHTHGSRDWEVESYVRSVEIYILGTRSWRRTEFVPPVPHSFLFPTYLKETINWVCAYNDKFEFIISYNLDDEHFQVIPPPVCFGEHKNDIYYIRMQELGGCLCVCNSANSLRCLEIWLMKDFSGKRLWNKAFCIRMLCEKLIEPVRFVNDGKLLLMVEDSKTLLSYNHIYNRIRKHKIRGIQSQFGTFRYIPNFLSMKLIVKGYYREILIVKY